MSSTSPELVNMGALRPREEPKAIEAQVPLAEMFGYSTALRSLTQGQAQFTMEFVSYKKVPQNIAAELTKKATEEKKNVA